MDSFDLAFGVRDIRACCRNNCLWIMIWDGVHYASHDIFFVREYPVKRTCNKYSMYRAGGADRYIVPNPHRYQSPHLSRRSQFPRLSHVGTLSASARHCCRVPIRDPTYHTLLATLSCTCITTPFSRVALVPVATDTSCHLNLDETMCITAHLAHRKAQSNCAMAFLSSVV